MLSRWLDLGIVAWWSSSLTQTQNWLGKVLNFDAWVSSMNPQSSWRSEKDSRQDRVLHWCCCAQFDSEYHIKEVYEDAGRISDPHVERTSSQFEVILRMYQGLKSRAVGMSGLHLTPRSEWFLSLWMHQRKKVWLPLWGPGRPLEHKHWNFQSNW
jgi:hypothetical protein